MAQTVLPPSLIAKDRSRAGRQDLIYPTELLTFERVTGTC